MENKYTVDIIIPTYKPDIKFNHLLRMLRVQTYQIHEIIIINTEEAYFPKEEYNKNPNMKVTHICYADFDHGKTRAMAASKSKADILIYMTQDAVPEETFLIEKLIRPFSSGKVGAAYARQLPAPESNLVEKYTRGFNYPEKSSIKSRKDIDILGIKTYFCSNVCAAYRRTFYEELGGFVMKTIFNEDMIFAGKLINAGYEVAYVADAKVIHSHNYGNIQQLKRNFDLGVSQAEYSELFNNLKSENEGMKLVKQTASHLIKIHKPWLIIDLVLKSGFKLIGFKLGKMYKSLPKSLILKLTMNKAYWNA